MALSHSSCLSGVIVNQHHAGGVKDNHTVLHATFAFNRGEMVRGAEPQIEISSNTATHV